jgi:hypothetical protein
MYVVKTAHIFILTLFISLLSLGSVAYGQSKPEVTYIRNPDIGFNISAINPSKQWDYILNSDFCFTASPPSAAGSASVQLTMELKDKVNPAIKKEEVIGASVNQLITTPSTARCGSGRLRRLVANAPFNVPPQERWVESCPRIKVKVTTKGPWRPIPQEDVAYIERSFLCPDGVIKDPDPTVTTVPGGGGNTPTPNKPAPTRIPFRPRATTTPAAPTSTPILTATPTPTPDAIEGRITVFSCAQPENVTLSYCDDPSGTSCADISLAPSEQDQSVWLDDDTNERTFIYKYRITKDKAGNALDKSKTYAIYNANARIKRFKDTTIEAFASTKEDKKEVSVPGSRDLTVNAAAQTCACVFHARAHVRDADTGEITTALDEALVPGKDLTYGSANDMQIITRGDKPVSPFTNGVLDVLESLHDISYSNKVGPWTPYGIDGMAHVRLYAPGYSVVKQRCQTTPQSQVHACPGGTLENESTLVDEPNFLGFRVACGVDVSYDWYIRKNATGSNAEVMRVAKPEDVDINNDGFINTADLVACIDEWGQKSDKLTCDINKDKSVDALDLSLVTSLQGVDVNETQ